jgi:D-sedoheptulose 7-phosphate isomerase
MSFRKKYIKKYLVKLHAVLDSMEDDLILKLDEIVSILMEARDNRNTIFFMGNGGSAATASHFVCDLSKGTIVEGNPRFKSVSLTDNMASIMAWSNDLSYEDIFVEQLKNLMEPNDIVIGISGSGNSSNVIKAIQYANDNDGISIGLSGYDGGKLLKNAQYCIHVPIFDMQIVEDIHMMIDHLITSLIRNEQEEQKRR